MRKFITIKKTLTNKVIAILVLLLFNSNVYSQLTIVGQKIVCEHETEVYTLQGATFCTLNKRDNFAEINSGPNKGYFDLECKYENTITKTACSGSATIHVDVLSKPEIVTNNKHCINSAIPCTLIVNSTAVTLTGSVEWTITDPFGGFQTFTSNSNPYNFPSNIYSVPGIYRISAKSLNSEFCEPEFVKVEIVDIPPKPTNVYGDDDVCLNVPYTYTTDIIDNTIMNWSLVGANTPLTSAAHTRTIIWNTQSSKNITVYRELEDLSGCVSQSYSKTINNISVTGNITSSTITGNSTYEDVTDNFGLSLNNGIVPEVIEWIVPPSAGIISVGQGTLNCSITWLHQVNSLNNILIKCNITKCGQAYTSSIFVDIHKSAEITSITANPSPVCSGTSTTFTVNSTGAPISEYIIDFGDGNTQSITTNNSTSPFTFQHIFINSTTTSISFPVKVKVRSSNNSMITSTQVYNITVNPLPNVTLSPVTTVIPPSVFPVQLLVASSVSTGNTYQWHFTEQGTTNNIIVGSTNTHNVTSTAPSGASSSFGHYWCVVTNSFGCSNESNKANIEDYNFTPSCAGLPPAHINNMPASIISSNTNPCGSGIQVNCNTTGALNVNIVNYNWSVDPTGHHTTSGISSKDQSPIYSFDAAGIYRIILSVDYVNLINGDPPCNYQEACNITIPMVADMEWGLLCNSSGNGYEIKLIDNSTLLPTYTLLSRTWEIFSGTSLITAINALSNPNYTYAVPSAYLGTTLDVKLSITNTQQGSNVICSETESISIPNLPVADFSVITTYPNSSSNPYKTCEGREVAFVNNSSPMADIHTHIWDFNNGNISHIINASGVYNVITGQSYYYTPSLTVTDNHGCWDTKTKQIQVFDNNLQPVSSMPNNQYNPPTATVCPDLLINPVIQPNFTSVSSNLNYTWYKGTNFLPNAITQNLAYAFDGSGAYWVRISNEHACYLNLNPTPAMVSVNEAPTAIIVGKTDVCDNEPILSYRVKTGMSNNANLSYSWNLNGTTLGSTTKEIQLYPSTLNTGVNQLSITVTDLSTGGCSTTSSPFLIELHSAPQSLAISPPVAVDCSTYELSLTGSATSLSAPLTYNWSTGISGQTVSVFNGGAYRLWVLDKYGCKNHIDRAIQYPPDFYFWRFPTGCYSFCEGDMYKTVFPSTWAYGAANSITFSDWAWIHNGAFVTINGPSFTLGSCTLGSNPWAFPYSIPCRLLLDNSTTNPNTGIVEGEGAGDYSWMLNNGLCQQESDILSLSIKECCELELNIVELRCIQSNPNGNTYYFEISVDMIPCLTKYNLSIEDNNPWPLNIIQTSLSLTTLNPGQNSITGQFIAQTNSTDIRFFINILCEDCSGKTLFEALPSCSGSRLGKTDSLLVDSLISNSFVNVFPNPANENINILFLFPQDKNNIQRKNTIKIMDAYGRTIKEIDIEKTKGELKLNTATFVQGIYFVGLLQDDVHLKAKRFIINH